MKKLLSVLLVVIISPAAYATPSNTPDNVLTSQQQQLIALAKALCLSPDKAGSQWDVTGGAKVEAKAPIRVVKLGGELNIGFTRKQWEGLQRVLPGDQGADNKRYSDCTTNILPMLQPIVYPSNGINPKTQSKTPTTTPVQSNSHRKPNSPASAEGKNSITTGAITNSKVINQNEVNTNGGDISIDMSN